MAVAAVAIVLAVAVAVAALAGWLVVSERRRHEHVELENARLLAEATIREEERRRLADRVITAEQDERRRLALFLHDGPVQNLSGIALMLDAAVHAVDDGRGPDAKEIMASALQRHRETIKELRDLSFNIEPVVLRDRGFGAAVAALASELGIEHQIQIDVDVTGAAPLGEQEQVGLYQIVREALSQAIRRGPPTRIEIAIAETREGGVELLVRDDGKREQRRASLDAISERAATLNGRLTVEQGEESGTAVRVVLPPYAAGR
ncbi:MAG TPA: histidine kinase [Gaiellaceae bacterium]|nr:histidine kinase [Gaiellaceae bacterium]